jgi:capsule polysaccharide export protein KpsE/RkpR
MIDLSAISVALSSLGVADEMVETIIGLTDCADLQSKLKEARSKLIDASDAVFAARDERVQLLERIHQLENELADYKAKYGIIPLNVGAGM